MNREAQLELYELPAFAAGLAAACIQRALEHLDQPRFARQELEAALDTFGNASVGPRRW